MSTPRGASLHPATFGSRGAALAWSEHLDKRLWEVVDVDGDQGVVPAPQRPGRFQLRLRPAKNAPAAE